MLQINERFISVVSPVFQAEGVLSEFIIRVSSALSKLTNKFEIVLVEDGSLDKSWEDIERQCNQNPSIKGIKLSRNFGQHYAVTAGLESCSGQVIVIMDCDLQDDPEYLGALLKVFDEGNEIVFTKRLKRKHTFVKSIASGIYKMFFSFFSERTYDVDAGSLVMISERAKNAFLNLREKDRLYLQMLKWIGFKHTHIEVDHRERFSGKSSYTFAKLLKLAIQGWTSHSDRLLRFSIYGGFILSLFSFVIGAYIIIQYFLSGFQPGWPSLFVAILFSTGLILSSIGIAGVYIGKIFEQSKNRPLFIIDQKINLP